MKKCPKCNKAYENEKQIYCDVCDIRLVGLCSDKEPSLINVLFEIPQNTKKLIAREVFLFSSFALIVLVFSYVGAVGENYFGDFRVYWGVFWRLFRNWMLVYVLVRSIIWGG